MNRTAITCLLLTLNIGFASPLFAQAVKPARQAHAHNDYLHDRPLLDALDNGFCSVEADIYLIDGELLVAHDLDKTSPDRTLQGLYLDPLRSRIKKNNGSVYGDGQTLTLLIDIKSEGNSTYRALDTVLSQYQDILTYIDEKGVHQGAVTAIISGNRAIELIQADSTRYAGVDGRLSDLNSGMAPDLMPLISDNWGRYFSWRGAGEMSPAERERLKRVVEKAHADGRRVRFWATPDSDVVWAFLADANVDLINTDDLTGLAEFLRSR
ncbi:phosphatidylinositol-specific phospholipase C/glycerophosphodiester phosphodiesterase family protein [Stieleria sp. ICT_E10.1]|uniref:phosphatidylinositol-specific phospholipase C/glycerophosphodiester phosphodiesterase family protein n=1 Tax=Stieleria sedimenti TaxID=2976331 RepID=UPI00217FA32A|nr:phosphatidylinositol-specific phospholipase C/glycerophosphodiester phosphodiesterase family protein [Stieleria sedimenti]MCS7470613.1 phosphatidylinositol-specific phospholipase C/glycerophosphodiester phosphodiesterase family protein [Stieleria sedimenti]